MPEPKEKVKPVCPYCESDRVTGDALAHWNVELQKWEVGEIMDKGHVCEECDEEIKEFKWMPVKS